MRISRSHNNVVHPVTDALFAIVPLMRPVVGLMARPLGRPLAANVSASELSGSEKFPLTLTLTVLPSALLRLASDDDTGPSLVPMTVIVRVVDDVPPCESVAVYVTLVCDFVRRPDHQTPCRDRMSIRRCL